MTVIERILATMEEKGVSQLDISKATGMTTSTVSYSLRTSHNINIEYAEKIADVLGVSAQWLVTGEEQQVIKVPADPSSVLRDDESELLGLFRSLDREGKVDVLHAAYENRKRMRESEARQIEKGETSVASDQAM